MENNIDFIARHYRKGAFSTVRALKRLNPARVEHLRRLRIAASVALVVGLSAVAAIIYNDYIAGVPAAPASEVMSASPLETVKVIDFEDASLHDVINRINEVYSVRVVNVPADADVYHLSLHFEGNPVDLVAAINDILGTDMSIAEK